MEYNKIMDMERDWYSAFVEAWFKVLDEGGPRPLESPSKEGGMEDDGNGSEGEVENGSLEDSSEDGES